MNTQRTLPAAQQKVFAWCTYRDWSFHVLEGLLEHSGWTCGLIITTESCLYPLERFEALQVPVVRLRQPKVDLMPGGEGYAALMRVKPSAVFHLGWSWLIPSEVLDMAINLTLHPGRLPRGRGGSPIQNQVRNGDDWTWANLIELVQELDAGPIFERERIELHGETTDPIWSRMISAGLLTIMRFLRKFENGMAMSTEQDRNTAPEIMNRVTPENARIETQKKTARQIVDMVRAHQETDPNTYVRPAWIEFQGHSLILERARLQQPQGELISFDLLPDLFSEEPEKLYSALLEINNGNACLQLHGMDGEPVYVTQVRMPLRED